MAELYTTTPEPDRPPEWTDLERDSNDPGILRVQWDPTTDKVRKFGPIVEGKLPERPAP